MFNDDLPKPKIAAFPRNLDSMSIEELEEYTQELKSEIDRVQGDINRKKASRDAAASVFKS